MEKKMDSKKFTPFAFMLILLVTAACNLAPAAQPAVTSENTSTETVAQALVEASTQIPVLVVTETATVEISPTLSVSTHVIITATTGSLSIRRGPGTAYNLLGYLQDGQTGIATARDTAGTWLYIPIPAYPSVFGWVSAGTSYSTITGDINTLPVMSISAAEPITIRNCTYHPMLITPLNITLAPQNEAPGNLAVVLPGDYFALDQSVSGTQVKALSLQEGEWMDITVDGLGNTYTCP
jgi:hypothetical protein